MSNGRRELLRWVVDLGLICAAFFLANVAKWNLPLGQSPAPATRFVTPLTIALLLMIWSLFARVTALYNPRQPSTLGKEIERAITTMALTTVTLAGVFLLLKYYYFSRLLLVYLFAIATVLLVAFRAASSGAWAFWRSRSSGTRRVILVGSSPVITRLSNALRQEPWEKVEIIGVVSNSPSTSELPLLGPLDAIERIVRDHQADEVIVVEEEPSSIAQVVRALQAHPVRIRVAPSYLELASLSSSISVVGDIPLLELRAPAISGVDAFLKRTLDIVVSILALGLLGPAMILIAILVKLSSPGPILFRQVRVGESGRLFTILKFRTMTVDAPPIPPVPPDRTLIGLSYIKTSRDNRYITPVGRLLRRFALDELPQFLNVIEGDMSLVGPRPEVPSVVQMYDSRHFKRLAIRPGLTGPMQVQGSSDLSLDERVKLELVYIQNYALWEDIKILARTLSALIKGKGVY